MKTKILVLLAAAGVLITPAQAQTSCIHDYRGTRCYSEHIEAPRPYGYAPRNHYRNDYYYGNGDYYGRREYRRSYNRRHRDVVLGLTLGIGSAIILNEVYRRR